MVAGQLLLVRHLGNSLGYPRLGMAVSARLLPRAVDRVRVRRMLRGAFSQQKASLGGTDCVCILRRPCPSVASARAAGLEFQALLDRVSDRSSK